jgi:hypothetical protein
MPVSYTPCLRATGRCYAKCDIGGIGNFVPEAPPYFDHFLHNDRVASFSWRAGVWRYPISCLYLLVWRRFERLGCVYFCPRRAAVKGFASSFNMNVVQNDFFQPHVLPLLTPQAVPHPSPSHHSNSRHPHTIMRLAESSPQYSFFVRPTTRNCDLQNLQYEPQTARALPNESREHVPKKVRLD